jgi:hypothetical protein
VEFEEGQHLLDIRRRLLAKAALSDTFWKGGVSLFPTFPQSLKIVFGWSSRRVSTFSI